MILEPAVHRLTIEDRFEGSGEHHVSIPLQLAPGVTVEVIADGLALSCESVRFDLHWRSPDSWTCEVEEGWVSPSYGVKLPAPRLRWVRTGDLRPLRVEIQPSA